jgi:hypothetical protein
MAPGAFALRIQWGNPSGFESRLSHIVLWQSRAAENERADLDARMKRYEDSAADDDAAFESKRRNRIRWRSPHALSAAKK